MSFFTDLAITAPFRPPEPLTPASSAAAKPEYVYEPSLWDRLLTSGPAEWLDQKLQKADKTLESAGGIAGTAAAVNSGLRWGLIALGVLLALFIIGEYKNVTR